MKFNKSLGNLLILLRYLKIQNEAERVWFIAQTHEVDGSEIQLKLISNPQTASPLININS